MLKTMIDALLKDLLNCFSWGDAPVEYVIYTFDFVHPGPSLPVAPTASRWEKVAALGERAKAFSKAESLAQTGRFAKVELKRKYFCKKKGRLVEALLRTYGAPSGDKNTPLAASAFALAVFCGLAALTIAYVMGQ